MALIKCPECQKEVNEKAIVCPHCGVAISTDQKVNYVKISIIVIACSLLAISGFFGFDYYRQQKAAKQFFNNLGYRVIPQDDFLCETPSDYIELKRHLESNPFDRPKAYDRNCMPMPKGCCTLVRNFTDPAQVEIKINFAGREMNGLMYTSAENLSEY